MKYICAQRRCNHKIYPPQSMLLCCYHGGPHDWIDGKCHAKKYRKHWWDVCPGCMPVEEYEEGKKMDNEMWAEYVEKQMNTNKKSLNKFRADMKVMKKEEKQILITKIIADVNRLKDFV